jgi:hypothetical protein
MHLLPSRAGSECGLPLKARSIPEGLVSRDFKAFAAPKDAGSAATERWMSLLLPGLAWIGWSATEARRSSLLPTARGRRATQRWRAAPSVPRARGQKFCGDRGAHRSAEAQAARRCRGYDVAAAVSASPASPFAPSGPSLLLIARTIPEARDVSPGRETASPAASVPWGPTASGLVWPRKAEFSLRLAAAAGDVIVQTGPDSSCS